MQLEIDVIWDAEASVWVARSDDVPGLNTEAGTFEALLRKLTAIVPELLEANDIPVRPETGSIHVRLPLAAALPQ